MIISKILSAIRKVRGAASYPQTKTAHMERLFAGMEAVGTAESEEELEQVLRRYPELVEDETVKEIGRMGDSARKSGDLVAAELFGMVFMRLHTFGRYIAAEWNTPKIASSVSWSINARKYLSLREIDFLNQAIIETEKLPDIQRFLKLFADGNMPEYKSLDKELIARLESEGREEEALTVKLISQHELACVLENIDEATLEEKESLYIGALNICEDSIRIARTLDDQSCQAFYLGVMGNCFWKNNLGSLADFYYDRAAKLYRELVSREPLSRSFLAITLVHLGNTKAQLQRFEESRTFFEEALQILRSLPDRNSIRARDEIAATLIGLGNVQNIFGETTHSEQSFAEALEIFRSLAAEHPKFYNDRMATVLSNLSIVQRKLNRFAVAEESVAEALEIYREMDRELADRIPYFFAGSIVKALNNLSNIQNSRGKVVEAEASLKEALELCRKLVSRERSIYSSDFVITLSNLGAIHEEQEKYAAAERYLTEAIQVQEESTQPSLRPYSKNLAGLSHNLGNAQRGNRKLAEAERSYAKALAIRRNLVQENGEIFKQDLVSSLNNLADLRLAQNNVSEAEKLYSEARDLLEQMREKQLTLDDRTRLMQRNNSIYTGLLQCYVRLNDARRALEIAEVGKSRSLSDLLNLKAAEWQPKAPTPATVAKVNELWNEYSQVLRDLQQLESYETGLSEYRPANPQLNAQWQQETLRVRNARFAKHSELKRVLAQIGDYDPNFPPRAKQIDVETVLDISRKVNRAIVIFRMLRKSTAIIFVFPSGELQVEEVKDFGRHELFEMFRDHWFRPYAQWKQGPLHEVEPWQDAMTQMLDAIYEKLLARVHRVLREKSGTKDVLLVPTQSLARLPLHAASWTGANGKKHYLCEEYTISYAPSVSVFKRCLENEKPRSNKTLLVVNPTLPGAAEEASYIEKLHESVTELPREQTKNSEIKTGIIDALQQDFGFAHFCCHGFYSQPNPFDSGLEIHEDVVIALSDIINCNLQNNWLTTLSACETGMVNFESPTDEHFGLPLGFIFAGSPSVWASLWLVGDRATSALMRKAYENLNQDEFRTNKPEALRQAQLAMLQESPHPLHWAGFQHFGV